MVASHLKLAAAPRGQTVISRSYRRHMQLAPRKDIQFAAFPAGSCRRLESCKNHSESSSLAFPSSPKICVTLFDLQRTALWTSRERTAAPRGQSHANGGAGSRARERNRTRTRPRCRGAGGDLSPLCPARIRLVPLHAGLTGGGG